MAAGRPKNLIGRRRKVGEDEEEDGPLSLHGSQSEGSVASERVNDSELATVDGARMNGAHLEAVHGNKAGKKGKTPKTNVKPQNGSAQVPVFKPTADTAAMLQGLTIADSEAVDYQAGNNKQTTSRQIEVKQPNDPSFIPNRGNFFMHDTRGQQNNGPLPFRGPVGRGRGRGGHANGTLPGAPADKPTEQAWKHDLHDSINEDNMRGYDQGGKSSARLFTKPTADTPTAAEPISFSSTKLLGRVQIRVMLPGMTKAITYAEVPLKKYVRLPDHRPPLRRDKPLRIFLPNIGPKYIFPSTDRSFIFIPRTMRPNHRGYGGNAQRSLGGYGYSSRRTSMYGGSVYSGSIAASRRSSIARDREGMFSPGSYAGGYQPPNRPVVRLPRGSQFYDSNTPPMAPYSGQHTPTHQVHTFSLPQQPAFQGTPTTTVQHPRPQKAISVSGIESPAALASRQTPSEQPSHSQLPTHLTEQGAPYFSPRQQYAYTAGNGPITSPLSQVPEQSAPGYGQQIYYPQQPYYYGAVPMPMYMPQQGFMYPQSGFEHPATDQSGMVAHESHGMVFYMPAADSSQAAPAEQFQSADGFVPNYATPAAGNDYYYNMANTGYYQPVQQS